MPTVDVTMRRSIRRGLGEIVVDSLLNKRQTGVGDSINSVKNGVDNVKTTFSSWDNCMAKSYCKWPVIAAITIAGLIVFSVLWCVIRCACCGMSCCCTCFSFLKCCDCCGGLCDGKKNKPHKHLDDPFTSAHATPSSGYRPPAGMPAFGGGGGFGGKPEPPQYAQFDVGRSGLAVDPKPLSEDALPPMPSWETAQKKHVVDDSQKDAVELGELDPKTGQNVPLMTGAAPTGTSLPPSPNHTNNNTPFSAREGQGGQNGYMGVGANDTYHNQNNLSPNVTGYGAQTSGVAGGYHSPTPLDMYGPNTNFIAAPIPGQGQRQRPGEPRYNDYGDNQFQKPGPYAGNGPRPMDRQYSDRSQFNQPPRGPSRGPGSPVNRQPSPQNNSGFDFGSNQPYSSRPGYPPQQQSYNSGRRPSPPTDNYYDNTNTAPSYNNRSPPPSQEPQYSGYQYDSQPTSHRRDPTALRPGAGRDRRQPQQGWDPVNNHY